MKLAGPAALFILICTICICLVTPSDKNASHGSRLSSLIKQEKTTHQARSDRTSRTKTADRPQKLFRIRKSRSGHFSSDAKINAARVRLLVDTGASSLALNAEDAHAAGLRISTNAYKVAVGTANGTVQAARARIRRLEIGPFTLTDIDALVLPEGALDISLLGMNVMSEFSRVEIKSNELVLTGK